MVTGLGSKVEDICGRDWVERGGDHGDPGELLVVVVALLCYWKRKTGRPYPTMTLCVYVCKFC